MVGSSASGILYEEGGYHGDGYHGGDEGEARVKAEDLDDVAEDGAADAGDGEAYGEVEAEGLVQLPLVYAVGEDALDDDGLRHEADEEEEGGEAGVAGHEVEGGVADYPEGYDAYDEGLPVRPV